MNFPTIDKPPYGGISEEYEDNSLISEFEDGSQQSRKKFTRSRRTFKLAWKILTDTEYRTLRNFIVNQACHAANVFNWTHPLTNEVVEVRCIEFPAWKAIAEGYWSGELTLKEV